MDWGVLPCKGWHPYERGQCRHRWWEGHVEIRRILEGTPGIATNTRRSGRGIGWVDSPSEVPEGTNPTDLYLRSREQGRGLSLAVPVFQEPMVSPRTFLLQSVSKETRGQWELCSSHPAFSSRSEASSFELQNE